MNSRRSLFGLLSSWPAWCVIWCVLILTGVAVYAAIPDPPTNVQGTPGWRQIALSWTASPSAGVSYYSIERGTQSGGPYYQVATNITGTTYTDSDLTTGTTYYYTVIAHAGIDVSSYSNQLSMAPLLDTKAPSVTITSPASNAVLTSLSSITGTSGDTNATGQTASGVERVEVFLYRTWRGVTQYWDTTSSTWQATSTPTPLPSVSDLTWTRNSGLPSGANLPAGQYTVKAQSFDKAGNGSTVITRNFKMGSDTTPPTLTITDPLNQSRITQLSQASGTITDEAGGSGVDRLEVRLSRAWGSSTLYWDGTTWSNSTSTWFPATLGTPTNGVYPWTYTAPLPPASQFPSGQYVVSARGYDCSQNLSTATSSVIKNGSDVTAPQGTIANPAANAVLSSAGLTQLSGTLYDPQVANEDCSGLSFTTVVITNVTTSTTSWWDPVAHSWSTTSKSWRINFTDAEAFLQPTSWSITTDLPAGGDLSPGAYRVTISPHDRTENIRSITNSFTVLAAPAAPTSLTATAGSAKVNLTWTAPSGGTYDTPDGYKLYRATTAGGSYTLQATVIGANALSYSDTQVTVGTTYYYVVKAFNAIGEGPASNEASATPYLDTKAPTVTIATPNNNITLAATAFTSIGGTSNDVAQSGEIASGVDHVDVFLYRTWRGVTEYWNSAASTWQTTAVPLPTATEIGWTRNTGLPTGSNLPSGQYQIKAQSFDKAGNASTLVTRPFKIAGDTTKPTVAITDPLNDARVFSLPSISGTIADETGGSGVDRVEVRLWRNWNGVSQFWDGTQWSATSTWLPAVLGSNTNGTYAWSCTQPLPPDEQFPDGGYTINAQGYDCSQNLGTASTSVIKVGDDATAPTVTISTPADNATLSSSGLTSVAGTALDPMVTGESRSGLNWVRVYLKRLKNSAGTDVNEYWNWTSGTNGAWPTTTAYVQRPFATPADANWQLGAGDNLPSGANLPAGSYRFQVKVSDITGNQNDFVYGNFNVVNAPAAPQNLTANAGVMAVALAWTAPTGGTYEAPSGYKLYRATTDGGPYTLLTTINSGATLSYNDTQVSGSTTYYYVVRAFNVAGDSPDSNQASATPTLAPDVTAPQGTLTSPIDGSTYYALPSFAGTASDPSITNQIRSGLDHVMLQLSKTVNDTPLYWTGSAWSETASTLTWSAPSPADGSWSLTQNLPTGTNLVAGTYHVQAKVYDGAGNVSTPINGDFTLAVPAAPLNLAATAGIEQVALTWSATENATAYNLYRSTTNGGPYTLCASNIAGTSYTNTGLVAGTPYFYVVRAIDAIGESADSNQASATPTAPPPQIPTAPLNLQATAGDFQVELNWEAPAVGNNDAPTGYKLYRSTVDGGPYTLLTTINSVATLTYTDTQVDQGTTYYYVVRAFNVSGQSVNSNQASAALPYRHRVDVMVRLAEATTFFGSDVYNQNSAGQTLQKSINPGGSVTYIMRVQNKGMVAESFALSGNGGMEYLTPPSDPNQEPHGWTGNFYDAPTGGSTINEISETAILTPELQPGEWCEYRLEVSGDETVNGSRFKANFGAYSPSSFSTFDGICTLTVAPLPLDQADVLIRNDGELYAIGGNIYNNDGDHQHRGQLTMPGQAAIYYVSVQNDRTTEGTFLVTGPAGGNGWNVRYFDGTNNNQEITSAITGNGWSTTLGGRPTYDNNGQPVYGGEYDPETGEYTPLLPNTRELRVEVTADNTVPVTDVLNVPIRVAAPNNAAEADVVTAETRLQKLLKLQCSFKYGGAWQDVPADGGSFNIEQGLAFGLKAIKANPSVGWPRNKTFPFMVPAWDNEGVPNVGDEIWVREENLTGNNSKTITASCGNTLPFKIHVRPGYVLRLATDTRSLLTSGSTGREAHLTATATLRDGTPVPDVKIRFVSTYVDLLNAGNPAGTFSGNSLQSAAGTSDATGQLTATLTADTPPGATKVKAQILGPQNEVWLETGSLNFTFQPPPDPQEP